jgi:hypothetical protein
MTTKAGPAKKLASPWILETVWIVAKELARQPTQPRARVKSRQRAGEQNLRQKIGTVTCPLC